MRLSKRQWWWASAGVGVIGLALIMVLSWRWLADARSPSSTDSTATHVAYSELYQAAWRQDDGRGNETFSATLLTPRLRELLAADTQRSAADDQIERLVNDLEPDLVPLVITMDAVSASPSARLTDDDVQHALKLLAPGLSFTFLDLRALVVPSSAATGNVSTIRRVWVAGWRSTPAINWDTVHDLQLEITDIGQTPTRTLTWARPSALVDESS